MGDVLEFVEMKEAEKHKTTEEFIEDLRWYIKEMNKLHVDFTQKLNGINTVFRIEMKKYKEDEGE